MTTLENILLGIFKKVIHLQFSRLVRSSFLGCLQSSPVFQSCGKTSLIQILSNKGFHIFAGSSGVSFYSLCSNVAPPGGFQFLFPLTL